LFTSVCLKFYFDIINNKSELWSHHLNMFSLANFLLRRAFFFHFLSQCQFHHQDSNLKPWVDEAMAIHLRYYCLKPTCIFNYTFQNTFYVFDKDRNYSHWLFLKR
jgi:hypothetical protein